MTTPANDAVGALLTYQWACAQAACMCSVPNDEELVRRDSIADAMREVVEAGRLTMDASVTHPNMNPAHSAALTAEKWRYAILRLHAALARLDEVAK